MGIEGGKKRKNEKRRKERHIFLPVIGGLTIITAGKKRGRAHKIGSGL